jgi:hypothetical protein
MSSTIQGLTLNQQVGWVKRSETRRFVPAAQGKCFGLGKVVGAGCCAALTQPTGYGP